MIYSYKGTKIEASSKEEAIMKVVAENAAEKLSNDKLVLTNTLLEEIEKKIAPNFKVSSAGVNGAVLSPSNNVKLKIMIVPVSATSNDVVVYSGDTQSEEHTLLNVKNLNTQDILKVVKDVENVIFWRK